MRATLKFFRGRALVGTGNIELDESAFAAETEGQQRSSFQGLTLRQYLESQLLAAEIAINSHTGFRCHLTIEE